MPRSSPTLPVRRADGRSNTSKHGTISEAGCGEETCTTVAIRLRPLNDREKAGKQNRIWKCVPTHNAITQTTPDGNPLPDTKGKTFFTYDRIFDEDSTTQEVYEGVAQEIVHSVVRGLHGTIFAYGQASSGKTFTMQGGDGHDSPGIVHLAARDLFHLMEQAPDRMFLVRVSYVEIIDGELKDLLKPGNSKLQVRQDPRQGVYIDAHEQVISNFDSVLDILTTGEKQRRVGYTKTNSRSSRSHTLLRLVVESQKHFGSGIHESPENVDSAVLVATLNLVDLAGYKSVRHTGSTRLRQKKGGKINQSLLTLSRVIQTLSQGGSAHVNYRDSKLTRILQPSLSGNAGMAVICCAAAAEGCLHETRSTLQFASRVKEMKTRPIVNEVLDDRAQLRRVSRKLAALKRQQAESRSCSEEKAKTSAKIERLNKLVINLTPVNEVRELHSGASPRYRRNKPSRETWCPGEGGVPLPLSSLHTNQSRAADIDAQDVRKSRKQQRSCAAGDLPTLTGRSVTRSPLSPLAPREPATPGFMSPAQARVQQEVDYMREKLPALQAEPDGKAAEGAAAASCVAEAEISRVRQLEAEVLQREQEVCSLKERLNAASKASAGAAAEATVAAQAAASKSGERIDGFTAQLAEAIKMNDDLKDELTEFVEYTDIKDKEMVEMKRRMAAMEDSLRQREAELTAIRAAEKGEGARNASLVEDLHNDVKELEAAIEDRGEDGHDALLDLKTALEVSQKELAEFKTRAERAEAEVEKLTTRLDEERLEAKRAAQDAINAVEDLETRAREERLRANEVLTRTLGAKRTLENALSSACETELRLRFRLEEAGDHAAELAGANTTGIGPIVQKQTERIAFLEERVGLLETSLRKAKEEILGAEISAEEARSKAADMNGSCRLKSAKIVQLTVKAERIKAECKKHEAKIEDMRAALKRAESLVSSKEEEVVKLGQHAADKLQEAQAKAEGLASELEAARQAVEVGVNEMAAVASKYEADAKDMRAALERVETSVTAKDEEIASLRQQAAHKLQEAEAKQNYLESELETTREALETGMKEMAEVALKYETETAETRAALVHTEASAMAMEAEVARAPAERQEARDKTDGSVAEFEAAPQAMDASKNDMDAALERADASESAKGEEVTGLVKQAAEELQEVDILSSELETTHETIKAGEEEMVVDVTSKHEAEKEDARSTLEHAEALASWNGGEISGLLQQTVDGLIEAHKADGLAPELESALETSDKEMTAVTSKYDTEADDMRTVLDLAEASASAKEEEVTGLLQEADYELHEVQAKAEGLTSAL